MPYASDLGKGNKKSEDQGFLANAVGKLADLGTDSPLGPVGLISKALGKDVISEEDAKANVRGVTDMLSPGTLLPAVAGAGLSQLRAPATALAAGHLAATGNLDDANIKALEQSPLSFAFDTNNIRTQQELFNRNQGATGVADKINAVGGLLSPAARNIQESFAETGLRAGAGVGAGITQTGAFGPRLTPNQAAELIGVRSYGQAQEEGQAGAMLLGDILNVAPALKGASFASSLNPIPEAAGAKIAQAGAALEKAPLLPYSVPAKGAYEALQAGKYGADVSKALTGLAAKEIPYISKGAGKAEEVAKSLSNRWLRAEDRAEALKQQGLVNREARVEIDTLAKKIDDLEAAQGEASPQLRAALDLEDTISVNRSRLAEMDPADPSRSALETDLATKEAQAAELRAQVQDSPELQQAYAANNEFLRELRNDALRETKIARVQKMHEMAKKYNIPQERLVKSDAFGRVFTDTLDEMGRVADEAAASPAKGLTAAEEFPKAMGSPFRNPGAGWETDVIDTALPGGSGFQSPGLAQREAASSLTEALGRKFPDIEGGGAKVADRVPARAVREIPEGYSDKYIEASLKGLETPVLPEGFAGKGLKYYDDMITAWKTGVLPFRPAWHTGNIVGNAMGAMLMGEVSPVWFVQNAKRIMNEVDILSGKKEGISELLGTSTGRGLGVEFANDIRNVADKGLIGKGKNLAQKSYKFNQTVDDFSHVGVALHELDRQLAAGIPRAAAVDAAEAFSLKTMGDFGNMGAGERAFVRRVLPFYPWYKHVAKASLRFPMENPGRFLQAQATARRLTGGPQEAPEGAEFFGGMIPMGGGRFLNVGGDIGLTPGSSPILNPTEIGGAVAPPIQWLGAANGLNLARGRELQAAPGQNRASAVAGYAINQLPLLKVPFDIADTVRGEGNVVRGDTRAPITSGGRPILQSAQGIGPLPSSAIQFLTGATYQEPNLKGAKARAKKTEKSEASKEKAYNKAVKKKPKK